MTPGGHQQLHSMNMFPVSMYRGPEEVSPEYAGYTESLNHPHQDIRMSKRIDTYPIIPQLQSTSSLPPQQQHQQSQSQGGRKRPQPKSNNNMQQPNIQSNMQPLVQDNQGQMTGEPLQPPAKKSRTNTPWTAAEEQRLRVMRDAGNSWADIAKTFPSRTEGSVKKHWYKDMHYADFAEDESVALLNAIKEYETNKWKVIGAKVGKPAKACEQYAKENFGNKV